MWKYIVCVSCLRMHWWSKFDTCTISYNLLVLLLRNQEDLRARISSTAGPHYFDKCEHLPPSSAGTTCHTSMSNLTFSCGIQKLLQTGSMSSHPFTHSRKETTALPVDLDDEEESDQAPLQAPVQDKGTTLSSFSSSSRAAEPRSQTRRREE